MPEQSSMQKYMFEESEINADTLTTFMSKYFEGSLKPFLKSEEPPEENDGPVTVVVGKTFEEIALDKTKDVLLEFYAPVSYCLHFLLAQLESKTLHFSGAATARLWLPSMKSSARSLLTSTVLSLLRWTLLPMKWTTPM